MPHHTEVPTAKRAIQIACAVIYCVLAGGIVFGFAALKPVLISEGVYRSECTPQEIKDQVPVCAEQEIRLNVIFTCAAVLTNVGALFVGRVLDTYGPRASGVIGSFLLAIGSLLMAFAFQITIIDAYLVGYLCLALGGPFVYISSFQLSNSFPHMSGTVLAMITGAFDASSAVFFVYRLIYEGTNGSFYPTKFFLCYLIVPVFILIVQLFVLPKDSYKTASASETTGLLHENPQSVTFGSTTNFSDSASAHHRRQSTMNRRHSVVLERKIHSSGVWGIMHNMPIKKQVMSAWFFLIMFFTTLQMLRINYFVASIRTQYTFLFDSFSKAASLNGYFDIALPVGGLIAVPFIGIILDNFSTFTAISALVLTATVIGVLGILRSPIAAYTGVTMFVAYRPFYYTTMSDTTAKVFGFETFGTIYGLIFSFAGLFNFVQTGLDRLTLNVFNHDPRPVNCALLGLVILFGGALMIHIKTQSIKLRRSILEREAGSNPARPL
ncbi:hypothetical protein CANCADRAFT_28200 [Tortispora caseinolytica NRRL Y-17796]|uniref:Nodulin-like domain-containing protein n=1 Tax=Tortispora caseinolytica NRRL Y-17796 TaxID=767744 RepID=A0A1E4TCG4_9ASCO|nr:hypothetical protein CANCADRAFT_28200 [Tortispora caseinolytica NRRL Y-17796]